MKRNLRNITMLALVSGSLAFYSCGEGNKEENDATSAPMQNESHQQEVKMDEVQNNTADFNNETVKQAYEDYLEIKDAMVASDPGAAKEAAEDLKETYSETDANNIANLAGHIATTDDINRQRELFSELTAAMEPVLKESINSGEVYKQYCPMAFEGKGDYWYSNSKEIRNPYFGDKMLKCGRVEETIN